MKPPLPLAPLVAALLALAVGSTATAGDQSCIIDVPNVLGESGRTKTADVTPLAEGIWVGNIYVLPFDYAGTYNRLLPGGQDNVAARQWVAQSFFAHNSDTYDFLAVVTDFEFDAGWGQHGDPLHALYWSIRNDVSGIGLPYFDTANAFGTRRLQGYIDANDLDLVRDIHGNLDDQLLLTVLNHELGHRWLAHCSFEDGQGNVSGALRGVDGGHWSYLLDTNASYMYGAEWQDNGDGSFTSVEIKQRFSQLDLYLMGMIAPDEVRPFTLLHNPLVSPDQYPELGAIIDATPLTVTVDQVVAVEGPRNPAADEAPHELRIAFIYLVEPGSQISNEDRNFLDSVRDEWQRGFFAQTEGRGLIGVGRNSLPAVSPASIDLDTAVDWLLASKDGEGLWQDHPSTRGRDSAAAIAALDAYGGQQGVVAAALDSVADLHTATTEVNAWRALLLADHQHPDATDLLNELSAMVLVEGAWGSGPRYAGDTVTPSRIASALAA